MNCWANEVRRLLVRNLEDEFCKVRLGDFDARGLEMMIQVNFFRGHALAFDDQSNLTICANLRDIAGRVLTGPRQKEMSTLALHAGFERGQQFREADDRSFFYRACFVFEPVVVRNIRHREITAAVECLSVTTNGRALNFQRHANGCEQGRFLALVRNCSRRSDCRVRHALLQDDDVQPVRPVHTAYQRTHVGCGAWACDEDKVALQTFPI